MDVVRQEPPGIQDQLPGRTERREAVDEVRPIVVSREDFDSVDPRPMTWWKAPGASTLGCLGMEESPGLSRETGKVF